MTSWHAVKQSVSLAFSFTRRTLGLSKVQREESLRNAHLNKTNDGWPQPKCPVWKCVYLSKRQAKNTGSESLTIDHGNVLQQAMPSFMAIILWDHPCHTLKINCPKRSLHIPALQLFDGLKIPIFFSCYLYNLCFVFHVSS